MIKYYNTVISSPTMPLIYLKKTKYCKILHETEIILIPKS